MLTLIWCLFHPRVTAVVLKRPRSFCQKCRWQVTPEHIYDHDLTKSEWADYAAVQAQCGNLSGNDLTCNSSGNTSGNDLTCNSSGNTQPHSSQHAELMWTDPGLKSGISVHELISTLKKSAGGEWMFEHSPKILASVEKNQKATTTTNDCK